MVFAADRDTALSLNQAGNARASARWNSWRATSVRDQAKHPEARAGIMVDRAWKAIGSTVASSS
jgi:hypothetical protein